MTLVKSTVAFIIAENSPALPLPALPPLPLLQLPLRPPLKHTQPGPSSSARVLTPSRSHNSMIAAILSSEVLFGLSLLFIHMSWLPGTKKTGRTRRGRGTAMSFQNAR